ncbi:MAG: two-component system, OmpR family, response regulator [Actinomycetota bacterium]|nr:two-component system, OmpR family, response regulator [Actinomycetota bacterium]
MTVLTPDPFVSVPVPLSYVIPVYELIARLAVAPPTEVDGDETEPEEVTWPVEDLRRFAETPTTTSVTIGKVLDVLAASPGEYFSTSQLENLTGVPRSNLKGAFSALTRHLKAHYEARGWMLTFEWGPSLGAGYPVEAHYVLSHEQAERWLQARAS